ncbi:MAG: hypothetical protein V4665_01115 [Patescibacteria group bacterium]
MEQKSTIQCQYEMPASSDSGRNNPEKSQPSMKEVNYPFLMKAFSELELCSPVVIKALADGYTVKFEFRDGLLRCSSDLATSYRIHACISNLEVCFDSSSVVYWIRTPDGIKGLAILDLEEFSDE